MMPLGLLLLLAGTLAEAGPTSRPAPPGCATCVLDWKNIVCANFNGVQVELPGQCVATCQGITTWRKGSCQTRPYGSIKIFKCPSEKQRVKGSVPWSVMSARIGSGLVYIGRYKGATGKLQDLPGTALNPYLPRADGTCDRAVEIIPLGNNQYDNYVQTTTPKPVKTVNYPGFKGSPLRRELLIVGTDDRIDISQSSAQYPFTTALRLTYLYGQRSFICSGSLVAPNVLMTNGHCLYDIQTRTWATNIRFQVPDFPGNIMYNNQEVYVTRSMLYDGFITEGRREYDIGLLQLSQPLGNWRGWLGMGWNCDSAYQTLNMMGYPSDKQSGSRPTMVFQSCNSTDIYTPCQNWPMLHTCDSIGGQSGSPMYVNGTFQMRAVHSCEIPARTENCACWLRPSVWPVINTFVNTAKAALSN